ncbi:non-specific lipid transfer protein GPI-anchored 11-like [Malania oleifera]|uniref:non-specific lipid transfer protein GPI-anchored 11-like n=1 Tax=Malania oleifera TaxID=397392 RepID=UPI0025ADF4DA|nr:non-specific lipid transfer protein GPI-anchored 11-like [Malania oleifera]
MPFIDTKFQTSLSSDLEKKDMAKFWAVTFSRLALCFVAANSEETNSAPALAPATDCSNLILDMADCIPYLSNGSKQTEPNGSCCSGLKLVLKTDADCLSEAIKNSAQLGIELNISKALTLPPACGVSAPVKTCVTPPPKSSPKTSPPPAAKSSAPSSPTIPGGGKTNEVPVSSPSASISHSIPASILVFIVSAVVAFSCTCA